MLCLGGTLQTRPRPWPEAREPALPPTRESLDGNEVRCYQPSPAPRWWKLAGEDRAEAIARVRGWVEQVYRPGYGQLAATLGSCWEQHPLCLYGLDVLSELWSVLYLQAKRTPAVISAQAEFQADRAAITGSWAETTRWAARGGR